MSTAAAPLETLFLENSAGQLGLQKLTEMNQEIGANDLHKEPRHKQWRLLGTLGPASSQLFS